MTDAALAFGRDVCGALPEAERREWLVTNGIGGYASGTVANLLTRGYHGVLVAALQPPVGRTLMLARLDATATYLGQAAPLFTNRWRGGALSPAGHVQLERFFLDGAIPVWWYAVADALIEVRIWMEDRADTTYVRHTLLAGSAPLSLAWDALVDYRDHHSRTAAGDLAATVTTTEHGVRVVAKPGARTLSICGIGVTAVAADAWCLGFDLARERERGLQDYEDHLHAATLSATLEPGRSVTIVASAEAQPDLDGEAALARRQARDAALLAQRAAVRPAGADPAWVSQLVLAADQLIVDRGPAPGKTVIAGYPWFTDWGRDTMISLPGIALATGRADVACGILTTFAGAVSQGMLPNRFPDGGEAPEYNTIDATLWYFEAIRAYVAATNDLATLRALYPVLVDILDWHRRGTRYDIHVDPADGLLYGGQAGVQLTWMDARVGDWVVTPRIGKPVEVNALFHRALRTMVALGERLGAATADYAAQAERARTGFARFFDAARGYCYDVLDGPAGDDGALRPNQILAVSLPDSPLTPAQQRAVVDVCGRALLTSHGLRSLAPGDPAYQGHYGGDQRQRDGAYHQGTVWGWLKGPFVEAHYRVYGDAAAAARLLAPLGDHLRDAGLGTLSEIFDGDAPMAPRGCIAQAWSVAEVLRVWDLVQSGGARSEAG